MIRMIKNQKGINIVGQGGKIILFMLPALIAAILANLFFPQISAFPEQIHYPHMATAWLGWLAAGISILGFLIFGRNW